MTDIEQRLRAAMHAAMDPEEAAAEQVLRGVYRRHRRHSMLVTGLAVLISAAVAIPAAIATRSFSGTPAPATRQTPAPATPQTPAPATLQAPPQPLPTTMSGLPMATRPNFRFLVSADTGQAAWYTTATKQTKPIAGLLAPGRYQRVTGGWATALLLGGWTCPPHCWTTLYFVADGATRASQIGVGRSLVASDRAGAVWLLSYAHTITSTQNASASIQLFSTTGHALGPHYRLPAGYVLVRGVGRYLLLTHYPPRVETITGPVAAALWDPRSRRVVDTFPSMIDAGPGEIAWSPQCRGCDVQLLNVATGKSMATPIPGGQPMGLSGSFSDDGTLLVVRLPSQQLAVYNISSKALTVIPGTALSDDDWQNFGWMNGSHTLVVTAGCGGNCTTGPDGPDQLAYWQPGDVQLRVATVTDLAEIQAVQSWES